MLKEIELEFLHTPEETLFGKIKNILFGAFLYIIWGYIIIWAYKTFIPEFLPKPPANPAPQKSPIFIFLSACVLAPLVEELMYRYPLVLLKNQNLPKLTLVAVVISSVLFGYAHWGGPWTVPVQGVAGIIFAWVFLKNGYSYVSSVLCHFTVNLFFLLNS